MRKVEDLSPRELLALAIAVEEANTSRFETLAGLYDGYDKELHSLFVHLREQEIHHARILRDEWARRFGTESVPMLAESDVAGVVEAVDLEHGEHAIFDDVSRASALSLVERSEDAALKFYLDAAAKCPDPGLRALCLDLAAMEEGHINELGELSHEDGDAHEPS